jgi:hypothetical protein
MCNIVLEMVVGYYTYIKPNVHIDAHQKTYRGLTELWTFVVYIHSPKIPSGTTEGAFLENVYIVVSTS